MPHFRTELTTFEYTCSVMLSCILDHFGDLVLDGSLERSWSLRKSSTFRNYWQISGSVLSNNSVVMCLWMQQMEEKLECISPIKILSRLCKNLCGSWLFKVDLDDLFSLLRHWAQDRELQSTMVAALFWVGCCSQSLCCMIWMLYCLRSTASGLGNVCGQLCGEAFAGLAKI